MANYLYVANPAAGGRLYQRDPTTGAAVATVSTVSQPILVAVSPDGSQVACSFGGTYLQFVNTSTLVASTQFTTSVSFWGLCWAKFGTKVFCQGAGSVVAYNTAGTLLSTWTVAGANGQSQIAISPDGTKLYCTCDTVVKQVDTTTGLVTATYPTMASSPSYGICVSPDGSKVYVNNGTSPAKVYAITVSSGTLSSPTTVGNNPGGMCVTPDGTKLFCTSYTGGAVYRIDTSTMTVTATASVNGAQEVAVVPDGSIVWATDYPDAKIFPINPSTGVAGTGVTVSGGLAYGVGIIPPPTRGPIQLAPSWGFGPATKTIATASKQTALKAGHVPQPARNAPAWAFAMMRIKEASKRAVNPTSSHVPGGADESSPLGHYP